MSYVVGILRPIAMAEVKALVAADEELAIENAGENWVDLVWSSAGAQATLRYERGQLTLTSPSDTALEKAQSIAAKLQAQVVGEEDDLPINRPAASARRGHSTWLGWPVLVVVLGALLAWKW